MKVLLIIFFILTCNLLMAATQLSQYHTQPRVLTSIDIRLKKVQSRHQELYFIHEGSLQVEFPRKNTKREVRFKYYESERPGPRPLVIVLPPIVGSTVVDRGVSKMLAESGVNVILPEVEDMFSTGKSLNDVENYVSEFLMSLSLLVKSMKEEPSYHINPNSIGIFGVSLGAVVGSALVGLDENITHAYLVAGGGNMGEVSLRSDQTMVRTFKSHILSKTGLKEDEWVATVRKTFSFEPILHAHQARHKKIFMVMCNNDSIIPFENQVQLWNEFGRPERKLSNLSHIGTVIRWFIESSSDLIDFFSNSNS